MGPSAINIKHKQFPVQIKKRYLRNKYRKSFSAIFIMNTDTTSITNLPISATSTETTPAQTALQPNITMEVTDNNVSQQNHVQSIVSGIQKAAAAGATQLPSRDIPMNTNSVVSDECAKPNYIPHAATEDYIQNHASNSSVSQQNTLNNNKKDNLEYLLEKSQVPILVGLLFWIFNLPLVKQILTKYFSFLFKPDGNYNKYGYLGVSSIFGLSYAVLIQVLEITKM
jgi:hypothetical protein